MAHAAGDIGIDLGTSNVVIFMKGHGVVFREPAVVAVDRETNHIIAFGSEAWRMIGRAPSSINIIRPLAQGEMIDFDLTSAMLRHLSPVLSESIFWHGPEPLWQFRQVSRRWKKRHW